MANFLEPILNIFAGKTENKVVGIDIGSSSIKVVELKKKRGRAVLQTYGEIYLGPYGDVEIGSSTKLTPAKTAEALMDVLKESNTSTPNSAVSIPMRSSMVSIFKMPFMKDKQLSQMVPIESRKYIPVPISEVALDWFEIPTDPTEIDPSKPAEKKQVEIMVIAIHNDVLSDYSSIVGKASLQTSFFEIEMFSTIRSVVDPTDTTPVLITDIGASSTKIYVAERGVIKDSHIINSGSQKITANVAQALGIGIEQAEQLKRNYGSNDEKQDAAITDAMGWVMDPIMSDTRNILMSFQQKHKKVISKSVLVGGGSLLQGLPQRFQEKLEVETQLSDPFAKVDAPAFLNEALRGTGASFSVAIGLALRKLQEME